MDRRKKELLKNYALVTLACLILAFGSAVFIVPNNLVTGGLTSVGVITQFFITKAGSSFQAVDLVNWAGQILFLVVSFIFLGRQYTARSFYASLLYPLFFSLFYRLSIFNGESLGVFLSKAMQDSGGEPIAISLLAAVFGGALVGSGVALSLAGGGTTGGFDVLSVLLAKVTRLKESHYTFFIDATLVIVGMIVMWDINQGLLGIVSAFMCALIVQLGYVNGSGFVIADVVTEKVDEIRDFVVHHLDRSTTVFSAVGGYSGKQRTVVRVCLSKRQLSEFKMAMVEIDPSAFMTFVQSSMIHGEGFRPLINPNAKELIKQANETRKGKKKEK